MKLNSLIYILETESLCNSNNGMKLFSFVGNIYDIIKIIVPILIVIMGIIDLIKAVTSSKQDEMKKATSIFIKRLILGVIVFFVFPIVSFLMGLLNEDTDNKCMACFLNPNDKSICNFVEEKLDKIKISEIKVNAKECINSSDKAICCKEKYGQNDSVNVWTWNDEIGCQNTTASNPDN